jgi:hypothetical protein
VKPLGLSIYTFKKMKDRRVEQFLSGSGYQWEVSGHKERMNEDMNMVDVFHIHI